MKKFFSFLVLISLFCFSGTYVFAEEVVYDAYYMVTTPGENASTEMNVNYHTHNTLTSLEYTLATDLTFENKVVVTGDLVEFSAYDDIYGSRIEEDFELRNIISVYLKNLTPGTEYRYRINKGDNTYTDEYTFKTATGGNETSFLFVTDAHVFNYDNIEETEKTYRYDTVIDKAIAKDPNLGFVLTAGDMVDRGGKASNWHHFFLASQNLRRIPMVGTPGNHEYYHYSVGEYNAMFYNAHFNSPKNGPEQRLGSTSYFIYNDILFVQLDTVTRLAMDKQMEWFEKTVYENPTKYIIVTAHKPFPEYAEGWFEIFEQFSVDLVLAGHYHSDNYKPNYLYSNRTTPDDPNLGVTYLNGAGSGVKSVNDGNGYLITVKDEKITIDRYNESGDISTRVINSKRPNQADTITKNEFLDTVELNFDRANLLAGLTWSNLAFENVLKVEVADNVRGENKKQYIWTPSKTFINFDGIYDGYEYDYTATFTFKDGTTESINYTFDLDPAANPTITYDETKPAEAVFDVSLKEDIHNFTYFKVYLNDELFKTTYQIFSDFTTTFNFTDLDPKTNYKVRVEAYNHRDKLIYDDEATFTTIDFKVDSGESGCKNSTILPFTVLLGMSAIATSLFVLKRRQH